MNVDSMPGARPIWIGERRSPVRRVSTRSDGRALMSVLLILLTALATTLLSLWLARMAIERQARSTELIHLASLRDVHANRLLERIAQQRALVKRLAEAGFSDHTPADGAIPSAPAQIPGITANPDAASVTGARAVQATSDRMLSVWLAEPLDLSLLLVADRASGSVRWSRSPDLRHDDADRGAILADPAMRDLPIVKAFQVASDARDGEVHLSSFGLDPGGEPAAWYSVPSEFNGRPAILLARVGLADLNGWLRTASPAPDADAVLAAVPPQLIAAGGTDPREALLAGDVADKGTRVFAQQAQDPANASVELIASRRFGDDAGGLTLALAAPAGGPITGIGSLLGPFAVGMGLICLVFGAMAWRVGRAAGMAAPDELVRLRAEHEQMQAKAARDTEALNDSVVRIMEAIGSVSRSRDFTRRVPVTEDVTGTIADALNVLTEETGRSLAQLKRLTAELEASAIDLQTRSTQAETRAGAERDDLRQAVQEITAAAASIGEANRQAGAVGVAAARADEAGQQASQAVRATTDSVRRARELIRQTEKRMKRLGEHSQEIGQVVGIIESIAERTGILALNASLQAAAAGDAGRQFAGLADEVKRLSKSAGQATAQIARMVSAIQSETADGVAAVSGAIMQIVDISDLVGQADVAMGEARVDARSVVERIQLLADAVAEQGEVSASLQERARRLGAVSDETLRELQAQSETSRQLIDTARRLAAQAGMFRTGDDS